MNIDIDSSDLINALSQKIATLTVELETAKLGLFKSQEICNSLSDALRQIMNQTEFESSSVQIMDEEEMKEFVSDDSSSLLLEN